MNVTVEKQLKYKTEVFYSECEEKRISNKYIYRENFSKKEQCLLLKEIDFFNLNQNISIFFHSEKYNNCIHRHDFFKIIYVLKGEVSLKINQENYTLSSGSIFLLNPLDKQIILKYNDSKDLMINILISKKLINKSIFLNLFFNYSSDFFIISNEFDGKKKADYELFTRNIDIFIDTLSMEYIHKELYKNIIIESSLNIILSYIYRYRRSIGQFEEKSSTFKYEVIEYVNQNFYNTSLKEAACHFHYTSSYFSELVYKETGENFSTLVRDRCIQEAIFYLENTNLSIEKISQFCGYNNKSSFYKIFKRKMNQTPLQFRLGRSNTSVNNDEKVSL